MKTIRTLSLLAAVAAITGCANDVTSPAPASPRFSASGAAGPQLDVPALSVTIVAHFVTPPPVVTDWSLPVTALTTGDGGEDLVLTWLPGSDRPVSNDRGEYQQGNKQIMIYRGTPVTLKKYGRYGTDFRMRLIMNSWQHGEFEDSLRFELRDRSGAVTASKTIPLEVSVY